MTYYNPLEMHPDDKAKFLEWFEAEEMGLEPLDVSVDRFSVHNGWISGKQIVRNADGGPVVFNQSFVKVPFRRKQRNPMPEFQYDSGRN